MIVKQVNNAAILPVYIYHLLMNTLMFSLLRSPLANAIHLSDVNDLVKHVVTACTNAAELFPTIPGKGFIFLLWLNYSKEPGF